MSKKGEYICRGGVVGILEAGSVVVVTVTHTECVFPSVTEHRLGEHGICVPQPIP